MCRREFESTKRAQANAFSPVFIKGDNWNDLLKEVVTFSSVEEFWGIYVCASLSAQTPKPLVAIEDGPTSLLSVLTRSVCLATE